MVHLEVFSAIPPTPERTTVARRSRPISLTAASWLLALTLSLSAPVAGWLIATHIVLPFFFGGPWA